MSMFRCHFSVDETDGSDTFYEFRASSTRAGTQVADMFPYPGLQGRCIFVDQRISPKLDRYMKNTTAGYRRKFPC